MSRGWKFRMPKIRNCKNAPMLHWHWFMFKTHNIVLSRSQKCCLLGTLPSKQTSTHTQIQSKNLMNQSTTVLKDIPLEFDKFDNNLGISWYIWFRSRFFQTHFLTIDPNRWQNMTNTLVLTHPTWCSWQWLYWQPASAQRATTVLSEWHHLR